MLKINSLKDAQQMERLPECIRESIRKLFLAIRDADDLILKNTTVSVVERQSELAGLRDFGLEERDVLPEFIKELSDGEQSYTVLSLRVEDEERMIFYIPSDFLVRNTADRERIL